MSIFCGYFATGVLQSLSSNAEHARLPAKWEQHQILISLLFIHLTHIGTYSDENNSGFVHTLSTIVILDTKLVFSKYPVLVSA